MTTIAYRDGCIAADSLTTSHGFLCSNVAVKVGAKNGVMWAASGDAAWGKLFRDWMATGMNGEIDKPDDNTGAHIFLPNGDIIAIGHTGKELRRGLPFWADGSGSDYALGAMQMGATAEEAVRAAMVWDTRTGGEITVLRCEVPRLRAVA